MIERGGRTTTYESGVREIGSVWQNDEGAVRFTARDGEVDLGTLKPVE